MQPLWVSNLASPVASAPGARRLALPPGADATGLAKSDTTSGFVYESDGSWRRQAQQVDGAVAVAGREMSSVRCEGNVTREGGPSPVADQRAVARPPHAHLPGRCRRRDPVAVRRVRER